MLAVLGLASCFQAIVSAEDVTLGKPDPQVFLTAATRLGSAPARSIVVEDAPPVSKPAAAPECRASESAAAIATWPCTLRMTVYNWREGADKFPVPRITLHVWVVLTSACYRYGAGTWNRIED